MHATGVAEAEETWNRDEVVLSHLPLVRAIAFGVHENLPVHVDIDDLVHAGIIGLFDAAKRYNPNKKVAFASYAKHRIKGAILDSLRQLDWASRDLRRRHKQIENVTRDLAVVLQRNPTQAEVAEKLGVAEDRWRRIMMELRNVGLVSATGRGQDSEEAAPPDFPAEPGTRPDNICARDEMGMYLRISMDALPDRYRQVVQLYYGQDLTMREIGDKMSINESRVSQIHKSALQKMAVSLQAAGIASSRAF
jgi:RNA polymerase sigma factor for flagellar operon FliA